MSDTFTVTEAAKAAGLSDSVLRMWELRYDWPKPKRQPNGYRAYTHAQVEQLKDVAAAVKAGAYVGDLLRTGFPIIPRPPKPKDQLQETIEDLHRQVALLREVVMMDPGRRFSDLGEHLVRVALERSRASQSYLDRLKATLGPAMAITHDDGCACGQDGDHDHAR